MAELKPLTVTIEMSAELKQAFEDLHTKLDSIQQQLKSKEVSVSLDMDVTALRNTLDLENYRISRPSRY